MSLPRPLPGPSPITTVLSNQELVLEEPQARSCGQAAVGVEVPRARSSEPDRASRPPPGPSVRLPMRPHSVDVLAAGTSPKQRRNRADRQLVPRRRPRIHRRPRIPLPRRPSEGAIDRHRQPVPAQHRGRGDALPHQAAGPRGGRVRSAGQALGQGGACPSSCPAWTSTRPSSSLTARHRSPTTRSPSGSSFAPSRCRGRTRTRCWSPSCRPRAPTAPGDELVAGA